MSSDKKMWQETSRWLRVGALSVSALSPFINILLARLRANVEAEEAIVQLEKDELDGVEQSTQREINLDWQERLQAVGATVNDLLLEMQESPYGQRLQQQGDDLRERGSKLSQAVAERSSQLTQDLADRSNDLKERGSKLSQTVAERSGQLTQDLANRSSKLTQNLAERSSEISQELAQRSRQARRDLAGRDPNFWILLGFGSGLVAAAIVTYVLIRRRLQQAADQEPSIQLSYNNDTDTTVENALVSQPRGNIYSIGANGTRLESQTVVAASNVDAAPETTASFVNETSGTVSPVSASADKLSPTTETSGSASDAAFVGVSSTKQYYPVETPLDQLHTIDGEAVDVIYFSSEDEAQRQGFTAAVGGNFNNKKKTPRFPPSFFPPPPKKTFLKPPIFIILKVPDIHEHTAILSFCTSSAYRALRDRLRKCKKRE